MKVLNWALLLDSDHWESQMVSGDGEGLNIPNSDRCIFAKVVFADLEDQSISNITS